MKKGRTIEISGLQDHSTLCEILQRVLFIPTHLFFPLQCNFGVSVVSNIHYKMY